MIRMLSTTTSPTRSCRMWTVVGSIVSTTTRSSSTFLQQQPSFFVHSSSTRTSATANTSTNQKFTFHPGIAKRYFGSSGGGDDHGVYPFFVWFGETNAATNPTRTKRHQLLLPTKRTMSPQRASEEDPLEIVKVVNEHYEKTDHFVGGMGESDPGVWFVSMGDVDTLYYSEQIRDSIQAIKLERHGVPFGLFTTGLLDPSVIAVPLPELGINTLEVSLFAGTPQDYQTATGLDAAAFGTVCGFIADATEQGLSVEVGVLSSYAGPARDLALSLGAQNVRVYDREE